MAALRPALQYLGLAAAPPRRARARTPRSRTAPADQTSAPTPPHAPRRRRPRPLVALGLAQPPIRISGHPRIRQRALVQIHQRRLRERMVTASLAAVLLAVLASWGALRSPLMAVESVAVLGVEETATEAVLEVAAVRPGQNVLDVDTDRIEDRVTELAWVEGVTARRRLPSTIEIRVALRRPLLAAVFGEQTWLLDADGVVIGQSDVDPGELPIVLMSSPPIVGSTVDEPGVDAVRLVAAAMPAGMQEWIVGYTADVDGAVDARMQIPTDTGPIELVAHLGRPVDVPAKAATMASLIGEVIDQGQRPRAVDVRIPDRPVVIP